MLTFFSPKANDIVGIDCESLVKSLENPDPREFPEKLHSIVGKKHIFQFHYNTSSKQETADFIFNEILDKPDTPQQLADKPSGTHLNLSLKINHTYQLTSNLHKIIFTFYITGSCTSIEKTHIAQIVDPQEHILLAVTEPTASATTATTVATTPIPVAQIQNAPRKKLSMLAFLIV